MEFCASTVFLFWVRGRYNVFSDFHWLVWFVSFRTASQSQRQNIHPITYQTVLFESSASLIFRLLWVIDRFRLARRFAFLSSIQANSCRKRRSIFITALNFSTLFIFTANRLFISHNYLSRIWLVHVSSSKLGWYDVSVFVCCVNTWYW